MSDSDVFAFIDALPAHTAKLATVRPDGSPHVAPIWVAVDDDHVVFNTGADTAKGRAIRRDPRVALCFDDEKPPFSFVIIEGDASVTEDSDDLLHWATVIAGRYMGPELAESYGRRNAVPGELLVRLRPGHVVTEIGVAD
jgi:PPOX class probable F420-dependent enzyme